MLVERPAKLLLSMSDFMPSLQRAEPLVPNKDSAERSQRSVLEELEPFINVFIQQAIENYEAGVPSDAAAVLQRMVDYVDLKFDELMENSTKSSAVR